MRTHKDKSSQPHTHTHTNVYTSCYQDIVQQPGEWVICVLVCVCVLFRLMSLAQAVGHSNFAGVNSDLWLHYSWLDWFFPRGWPAAQHYTLSWHSQGHTLLSVPPTHPSLTHSSIPVSIYLTCPHVAPSCSHSSISLLPSYSFFHLYKSSRMPLRLLPLSMMHLSSLSIHLYL